MLSRPLRDLISSLNGLSSGMSEKASDVPIPGRILVSDRACLSFAKLTGTTDDRGRSFTIARHSLWRSYIFESIQYR